MISCKDFGRRDILIKNKINTVQELINEIYEDNWDHFDFMENMAGGDCDCNLHMTMQTIIKYWEG